MRRSTPKHEAPKPDFFTYTVEPDGSVRVFKRKHELREELHEPRNQNLSPSSGGAKPREEN
jgi:hypothetical protein